MVSCCSAHREKNTTKTKTHLCACLWIFLIYTVGMLWETVQSICGRIREQLEEPTCHICPVLHIHTKWRRLSYRCYWNNHEILRFTFPSRRHLKLAGGPKTSVMDILQEPWQTLAAASGKHTRPKKKCSTNLKTPLIRYNCIDKAPEKSDRGPSWHPSTLSHVASLPTYRRRCVRGCRGTDSLERCRYPRAQILMTA